MQAQLFIFDLDGTLADTHALNVFSYTAACAQHGMAVDEAALRRGIEAGKNWQDFLPGATGLTEQELKIAGILASKRDIYIANIQMARGMVSTIAVLQALHAAGHHTALATNANRANAQAMISHLGIEQLFGLCLYQEDLNPDVPGKQELFRKVIAHFGVPASLTTIFEDSEAGLAAAAQCPGVTVLQVGASAMLSQP